jgi:hypothetical protein
MARGVLRNKIEFVGFLRNSAKSHLIWNYYLLRRRREGMRQVALFLSIPLVVLAEDVILRGVHPDDYPKYKVRPLRCPSPDEPRLLSVKELDDNYCDCPLSGFDEAGTGACSKGKFWCHNDGYGKFIPNIWVDDGHCGISLVGLGRY